MRRKASSRLFTAALLAVTLLAPVGTAVAEEGGALGDLFRELLGGGESETAPAPQPATPAPAPAAADSKRVPFGRAEMCPTSPALRAFLASFSALSKDGRCRGMPSNAEGRSCRVPRFSAFLICSQLAQT